MKKNKKKQKKIKPRLLKGFRDIFSEECLARRNLVETIQRVYERYGFSPIETPGIEYLDTLGKYIAENDSAEEGVFAFRDDDTEWVALRYDLTAPLSRVIALYPELPRPFRRYQLGVVWRDERPGLGRFREFYQMDFDTVGTSKPAADAEVCMIICDVLEELGLKKGEYLVRMSNRKILNGVLELAGIPPINEKGEFTAQANTTLRAIDKLDRLGMAAVKELLGKGRTDKSSHFTEGAGLDSKQIDFVEKYLSIKGNTREEVFKKLEEVVSSSKVGEEGISELLEIDKFLTAIGYESDRIIIDPTIVRGLSYYTGPVFETILTIPYKDKKGQLRDFGSIFSGGRYDGLVKRFLGQNIPATGASIGLDRFLEAMRCMGKIKTCKTKTKVLVTTMDKSLMLEYQKITHELRKAGIETEMFLGKGGIKRQVKHADQWDIPLAIILGEDEMAQKQIAIKDLKKGRLMSEEIEDRDTWKKAEGIQFTVARKDLIKNIRSLLETGEICQ